MPKKTIGNPSGGKIDWLVESDREPPRRTADINDTPITITRYTEPQKLSSIVAPWFKPAEKISKDAEALPRTRALRSDIEDDAEGMDCEQDDNATEQEDNADAEDDATVRADIFAHPTPKAEPIRRRTGPSNWVTGRSTAADGPIGADGRRPMLLRQAQAPPAKTIDERQDYKNEDVRRLEEETKRKDATIASLQASNAQLQEMIKGLTEQVQSLQQIMASLQNTMQAQQQHQMQQAATAGAALQGANIEDAAKAQ
jgi:hypothetical protein